MRPLVSAESVIDPRPSNSRSSSQPCPRTSVRTCQDLHAPLVRGAGPVAGRSRARDLPTTATPAKTGTAIIATATASLPQERNERVVSLRGIGIASQTVTAATSDPRPLIKAALGRKCLIFQATSHKGHYRASASTEPGIDLVWAGVPFPCTS